MLEHTALTFILQPVRRLTPLASHLSLPAPKRSNRQMRQEIEVMRHLYHRSVVLLFSVLEEREEWEDPDGESEGRVCMIQEYMEGGPTMTYDDETGRFTRPAGGIVGGAPGAGDARLQVYPEGEAKPLFRDLVQGLLYLHGEGIVHRDIKVCRCVLCRFRLKSDICRVVGETPSVD